MNFRYSTDTPLSMGERKSTFCKNLKNFTASKLTQFSSKYLVHHYNTFSDQDMSYDDIYDRKSSAAKSSLSWPPLLKHGNFSGYQLTQLQDQNLFKSRLETPEPSTSTLPILDNDDSILVTGFGMRNASSLARILARQKKPAYVSKYQQSYQIDDIAEEEQYDDYDSVSATSSKSQISAGKSTTETISQTETPESRKASLEYLLALEEAEEEEQEPDVELIAPEIRESEAFIFSASKSMRDSQRYLRTHRIFEFFQFLIAHLLSSKTDNPVEFILDLLNQCLSYRSGLGTPPLLYQKKHIEQLFKLMDRMETGFVELEQYHTAMKTFGICAYNETPELADGLVSKSVFVDQIYEAEVDIFNDLIRRHRSVNKKQSEDFVVDDKCAKEFSQGSIHVTPANFLKPHSKDIIVIKKHAPRLTLDSTDKLYM